jgi:hypothetical protein
MFQVLIGLMYNSFTFLDGSTIWVYAHKQGTTYDRN